MEPLFVFVRATDETLNTPMHMQRADQEINMFGAMFFAPEGMPIQETDGTFKVQITDPSDLAIGMITRCLKERSQIDIISGLPE